MACTLLSAICLAYWAASIVGNRIESDPVYVGGAYISTAPGAILISGDQLRVVERERILREADNHIAEPAFGYTGYHELILPGLTYRSAEVNHAFWMTFDSVVWVLSVSAWLPSPVFALLAVLFFYRLRAIRREGSKALRGSA
jgi:hypothetical protein